MPSHVVKDVVQQFISYGLSPSAHTYAAISSVLKKKFISLYFLFNYSSTSVHSGTPVPLERVVCLHCLKLSCPFSPKLKPARLSPSQHTENVVLDVTGVCHTDEASGYFLVSIWFTSAAFDTDEQSAP